MPKTVKTRSSRKPRLSAETADIHDLYQRSVQDPDSEVKFIDRLFRDRGRPALSLREDFCGTALLCSRWVQTSEQRQALGIDLDPDVLAWGREHNVAPLGASAKRLKLLEQDVLAPSKTRHDVVVALNFSYFIFKTREVLRSYFSRVRKAVVDDGCFVLDAYGGWEALEPMLEPRKIAGGFTYVWDQDGFDPISHEVLNHIHFEFPDKTRIDRAFTYDWRFWSLPEIQELLLEAGFEHVQVWWDVAPDDEDADYVPRKHIPNQPGWVAYIVASPKAPRVPEAASKRLTAAKRAARSVGRARKR